MSRRSAVLNSRWRADQKQDGLAVRRVQIEPLEAASAISTLAVTWLSGLRALARVVKKQRKVEQVGLLEFVEKLGIALVPLGLGLPQRVQILDGHEGVLVHREAVRVVADHERIDCLEIPASSSVSRRSECIARKRFGRMRRQQNFLQIVPELGAPGRRGGQRRQRLPRSGARRPN